MAKTMQAVLIAKKGAAPELTETTIPTIGAHDLLVNVRAASYNPVDNRVRKGNVNIVMKKKPSFPFVMGYDFAGIVVQVGSDVRKFNVGDNVYGRTRNDRPGSFANFMAVDEADVAVKPQSLSMSEAAALPLVGLTAYEALNERMKLTVGQKILILAGAGGVGTIAIQMAKQMGAYVATTASKKGYDLVKRLGADEIIDYHTTDFSDVLHDYDAVLDTQGGDDLVKAFQIVKPGGTVVSLAGMPDAKFANEQQLGWFKARLFGLAAHKITKLAAQRRVNYHFLFMDASGNQVASLTKLVDTAALKPIIDRKFNFDDAIEAINYAMSGHAKGKVIMEMPAVSLN
ncbi:NADP-dependent oxidoreductase [Furfurilactobacillus milii]|uniref:NADP-dependent oxidoreductase n=1 Tax=Furfurilactobacillus milii TaxID=2888272 RepID=UPI001F2E0FCC|nr:NADP-dependent oxidoreductase [Furfurilactobacillus milii]MCF6420442.1 NADP-dependent oxidoreductase [Furfurilactobacillus milii]